jgi:hypothetical protein
MLDSIPPLKKKSMSDVFPMASPDALDLITRTLQFNPDRRLSGLCVHSLVFVALSLVMID